MYLPYKDFRSPRRRHSTLEGLLGRLRWPVREIVLTLFFWLVGYGIIISLETIFFHSDGDPRRSLSSGAPPEQSPMEMLQNQLASAEKDLLSLKKECRKREVEVWSYRDEASTLRRDKETADMRVSALREILDNRRNAQPTQKETEEQLRASEERMKETMLQLADANQQLTTMERALGLNHVRDILRALLHHEAAKLTPNVTAFVQDAISDLEFTVGHFPVCSRQEMNMWVPDESEPPHTPSHPTEQQPHPRQQHQQQPRRKAPLGKPSQQEDQQHEQGQQKQREMPLTLTRQQHHPQQQQQQQQEEGKQGEVKIEESPGDNKEIEVVAIARSLQEAGAFEADVHSMFTGPRVLDGKVEGFPAEDGTPAAGPDGNDNGHWKRYLLCSPQKRDQIRSSRVELQGQVIMGIQSPQFTNALKIMASCLPFEDCIFLDAGVDSSWYGVMLAYAGYSVIGFDAFFGSYFLDQRALDIGQAEGELFGPNGRMGSMVIYPFAPDNDTRICQLEKPENAPKMVLEGPIKCDDDKPEEDSLQRLFQRVQTVRLDDFIDRPIQLMRVETTAPVMRVLHGASRLLRRHVKYLQLTINTMPPLPGLPHRHEWPAKEILDYVRHDLGFDCMWIDERGVSAFLHFDDVPEKDFIGEFLCERKKKTPTSGVGAGAQKKEAERPKAKGDAGGDDVSRMAAMIRREKGMGRGNGGGKGSHVDADQGQGQTRQERERTKPDDGKLTEEAQEEPRQEKDELG